MLAEAAAGVEQERGQTIRELDRPVRERDRAIGVEHAHGADRRQARLAGRTSASMSARETPSPASRLATSRGLASRRVTSSCR